jgi:alpha-L-rhamnosidase
MVALRHVPNRVRIAAWPLAALGVALAWGAPAVAGHRMSGVIGAPEGLRTDYAAAPLGLDDPAPRLMWTVPSGEPGAHEVRVAASAEDLADGKLIWDSGEVAGEAVDAAYGGPALMSRGRYYWTVRTWIGARPSPWSAPSYWEMGLLKPSDWRGQWIGGRTEVDHDWTDQTVTIDFTQTGADLDVLFRARPIGKTYGEAYVWRLEAEGGKVSLLEQTRHYPGGVTSATVLTVLRKVELPTALAADFVGKRHRLAVEARGETLRTFIDGVELDTLTDASQSSGTIGFSSPEASAAVIHSVMVASPDRPDLSIDFAGGADPFSGGRPAKDGLLIADQLAGKDIVLPIAAPAPLLRRRFDVAAKGVVRARLYIAGAGWPKLSLNGHPVGASALASGYTAYDKRVLYRTYDVTNLVRPGANALGAELGRGWYGLVDPNEWYFHQAPWHGAPALLAQLEITYDDGSTAVVASDDQWKAADGPTRFDSIYSGERYDARRDPDGWRESGFDDARWPAAVIRPGPAGVLVAATMEPIAPLDAVEPQSVKQIAPGVLVYDFGRIFAGRLNLTVQGPAGQTVSMTQGEKLNPDGSVLAFNRLVDGPLQTDRYTLSGRGVEHWSPSFSYKGFRYVQVEGFPGTPTLQALSGEHIHSDVASVGSFASSDAMLNAIQQSARNTLLNNMHGFQTDTPTYEKNGWTGDAQASAEAAIVNFDVARVWTKWLADFRDAQSGTGEIPEIVPSTPLYGYENTPGWALVWGPTPAWDAATFILPQAMYEQYGDVRILADMYETQKRLVDYTATFIKAPDYRYGRGLGEYGAPAYDGGVDATSSAYFYYMVDRLARNAEALGKAADAARYRALANEVRDAYNRKYWDPARELYRTLDAGGAAKPYAESQNVFPAAFGMVPARYEDAVVAHLADDLKARDYRPGVGVFAARYLLGLLSDHGFGDVAYRVATQTAEPGWGAWIKDGLTTMLEGWALTSRSYDHHYFASISAWFYQGLAGIQATSPGYADIRIRPTMPRGLDHVDAAITTVRGRVASRWARKADGFVQTAKIPGAARAEIWIACPPEKVRAPAGVRFDRVQDGYAVYKAGPGEHRFACNRAGRGSRGGLGQTVNGAGLADAPIAEDTRGKQP